MNDTKKLYGNSALHEAACAGDVQAVTDLLNILADVNARNKDDETFSPLLEEAFQDFLESPEGKEALKMEQTKVQKMFEKQQKREQKQYQRQQKYLAAKLKKDKRKLPAGPPTWISWAGTTFTSIYNPSAGNYHPPPILFLLIHEQIPNCDIMLILPHLPSFHPNFTRDVSRLIPIFVQNWLRLC